ncbi:tripartite tricarboxylate transporter substrate binding protein [Variovorax sp. J2P1-59]|uniref:Bug family tripartite tricarboxylate transporter substrate binding protein n=1 Tax=Variovorax flavidus TaxID=3053501 RepID=UPI0025752D90|nr:tripartite tricarboxylate transporter substrate binding protein [Variovorax sp. J2P1-59]MDM0074805.1 tripartite tricarboxylate transporter substrate binding protein [Variovorax sp. J2P1-59]
MLNRRDILSGLALAPLASLSLAQDTYPDRPIKMVVGFTPGGGADVIARVIGPYLSKELGQAIVVENKPGVGGNVAAQYVAAAKPDGYTVMMGTIAALAINPALYKERLGFDPDKDFAAITNAVDSSNVLVVPAQSKLMDVKQVIEVAKTGSLSYGSSGIGTAGHLAGEMFALLTGTKMLHVPYKSGGSLMTAILSGEVDMSFSSGVTAIPQIQGGKLRALGVTTMKRSATLPSVPTIAEAGVKGFVSNNWYGLVAPAATPKAVIDRLNAACVKVLSDPEVVSKLIAQAFDPSPMKPQEFETFMRNERSKWARVVKDVAIKLDT